MRSPAELVEHDRPLNGKHSSAMVCDRSPDQHARKPSVEQADPLHVGARQDGAKGAAADIGGAEEEQRIENGLAVTGAQLQPERGLPNLNQLCRAAD